HFGSYIIDESQRLLGATMGRASTNDFLRRLTRSMGAQALVGQSDRQLVEDLLAGHQEAAFQVLLRRHGPMVYRVCWLVLQHNQDVEAACQATFLLLARKLPTVRKLDSIASWLHGVAYRVALKAESNAAKARRHEQRAARPIFAPPDDITWRELQMILD